MFLRRRRITFFVAAALLTALVPSGLGKTEPTTGFDGRIAFVARTGETADLFVMHADGTRRHQLTHDAREEGGPTWSPDGKSIGVIATAFNLGGPSQGEAVSSISVMSANGTGRRRLFSARSPQLPFYDLAWSPRGGELAFTWARNGGLEVWLLRLNGNIARLTSTWGQHPSWGPDGKRLAYAALKGIVVVNVATRKTHRVRGTAKSACPLWSPNGKWIAVCSKATARAKEYSAIEILTPSGSRRQRLISGAGMFPVAWAPQSNAILFLKGDETMGRRLFVVSLRDGHVTSVPGTEGAIGSASWHR